MQSVQQEKLRNEIVTLHTELEEVREKYLRDMKALQGTGIQWELPHEGNVDDCYRESQS